MQLREDLRQPSRRGHVHIVAGRHIVVAGPLVPVGGCGDDEMSRRQLPVQDPGGAEEQEFFRPHGRRLLHQAHGGGPAQHGQVHAQPAAFVGEAVDRHGDNGLHIAHLLRLECPPQQLDDLGPEGGDNGLGEIFPRAGDILRL